MSPETLTILVPTAVYGGYWLIYSFFVWILFKMQKIQFSGIGLLAATAAAVAAMFIPYCGKYVSHGVLLFALWKCTTGASLAPDIVFTVGISGSLMFCVKLFLIAALIGNLGLSSYYEGGDTVNAAEGEDTEEVASSSDEPSRAPQPGAETSPTKAVVKSISLRGIGLANTNRPLAMIGIGTQVYSVAPGEGFSIRTKSGTFRARCREVRRDLVILDLEGGETLELRMK